MEKNIFIIIIMLMQEYLCINFS